MATASTDVMYNLLGEEIQQDQHKDIVTLLNEARQLITETYINPNDRSPIVLRCSFGKDSSILLKLTIEAVMMLPSDQWTRHIYIVVSDTMVETPIIKYHVKGESEKVEQLIKEQHLPMSLHIVKPRLTERYFYEVIGKGYSLPSRKERRCTQKLKTEPSKRFLKGIDYTTVMTGVRLSESEQRYNTYSAAEDKRMLDADGKMLVMPILDFWVEDIWEAAHGRFPWGSSLPLRQHYAEATGECGFQNPRGTEKNKVDACGARFGCFTCPVISADRSTEHMADHHEWLKPYTEWRELQMKVYGKYVPQRQPWMNDREWKREKERWEMFNWRLRGVTKSGYRRNGRKEELDEYGTILVEAREFLLQKLFEAQDEINRLRSVEGLEPDCLIEQDEIDLILWQHEDDRRNRPWLTNGGKDAEQAMISVMRQVEEELKLPFDPNAENLFTVSYA